MLALLRCHALLPNRCASLRLASDVFARTISLTSLSQSTTLRRLTAHASLQEFRQNTYGSRRYYTSTDHLWMAHDPHFKRRPFFFLMGAAFILWGVGFYVRRMQKSTSYEICPYKQAKAEMLTTSKSSGFYLVKSNRSSEREILSSKDGFGNSSDGSPLTGAKPVDGTSNIVKEDQVPTGQPPQLFTSSGDCKEFPKHVPYLIVGAGSAGISAAKTIRASDPTAKVLMVSDEPGGYVPYMRPPLCKELWRRSSQRRRDMLDSQGDMRSHSWIFYSPQSYYVPPEQLSELRYGGVSHLPNVRVLRLDPYAHSAELSNGHSLTYDQCLLATGSRPKMNFALHECTSSKCDLYASNWVSYFQNLDDYQKLHSTVEKLGSRQPDGGRIAVVGGGFLGSELTVALSYVAQKMDGLKVLEIYRESGSMTKVLPTFLAEHTRNYIGNLKNVEVCPRHELERCQLVTVDRINCDRHIPMTAEDLEMRKQVQHPMDDVRLQLTLRDLDSGQIRQEMVDHLVLAVGTEANTDLAITTPGLEVDCNNGGFNVNAELEVLGDIFVAGDAASYYDILFGRRREKHISHAEESGRVAGHNMAATELRKGARTRKGEESRSPRPLDQERNGILVQQRKSYQSRCPFWNALGRDFSWEAVGDTDPHAYDVHVFFAKENEQTLPDSEVSQTPPHSELPAGCSHTQLDRPAVVFYVQRVTGRIMGVLLWHLSPDLYRDERSYAPQRINIARGLVSERRTCTAEELCQLACEFDLYDTVDERVQELSDAMGAAEVVEVAPPQQSGRSAGQDPASEGPTH